MTWIPVSGMVHIDRGFTPAHRVSAGILYTSKETHYSVMKAARMYRMDAVEVRPTRSR